MFRSVCSRGEDVGVILVSEAPDDRHGREDRRQERGRDEAGPQLSPHVAQVIGLADVTFQKVTSYLNDTRILSTHACAQTSDGV